MIFSRKWLLPVLLTLCGPVAFAQSVPHAAGTFDLVPGKDFTHAQRFTVDSATGDSFVLGYDDDGPALKLVEHAKPGPTGDQPTGSATAISFWPTFADVAIDHANQRYYVLGAKSIVGYAFGSASPVVNIPLGFGSSSEEARQMALDVSHQRIYVSTAGGHALAGGEARGAVVVVDLSQGKPVATVVQQIFNPADLVVDEAHNKVYVFNRGSFYDSATEQTVAVINGNGFGASAIRIPVPESYPFVSTQRRLAAGPAGSGKVYAVVDRDALTDASDFSRIAVIDTATDTVSKQVDLLAGDSPRHAMFIAAHPSAPRLYVTTQEENNAVQVIDTATDTLREPLIVPAGGDFVDLAVDPVHQELQVLTSDSVLRTPLDGSGNYAQIWLAASPWMTAVNEAAGKLYVMDSHRYTMFVLSTATGELLKAVLLTTPDGHVVNPMGLAVNAATNRVYVTVNDAAAPDNGLLFVYDGADETLLKSYPVFVVDPQRQDQTPTTWDPAEMVVDAPNHRLFVRQSYYISIVDTETDTVDQAAIGTLPVYGEMSLMRLAYDPGLNQLFALSVTEDYTAVVAIYDVATKQQVATIGTDPAFAGDGSLIGQSDLVLNPDSGTVYVAGQRGVDDSYGTYSIFGFDTATRALKETYDSPGTGGNEPSLHQSRLALNRSQNRLYVATQPGSYGPELLMMRLGVETAVAVAPVGVLPSLAFSEGDQHLYISEQSDPVNYDRISNGQTQVFADPATPGTLEFSLSKYTVSEGGGTATITVKRSDGDYGAVSVQYATADSSAVAGQDYTSSSGTLSWSGGDVADKTFTVAILNDAVIEGAESLLLSLSAPTGGATLGQVAQAQLAITDDEVVSPNAPKITSALTAIAEVARPFTYRIVATKTPKTFEALNLPPGLTLSATGIIRGTPTTAGTYQVTLKATNNFGTGIATLALTVNPETRPELSGELTSLAVVQAANGSLVVSGFGKISNSGTRPAVNTRSQIYVSDDASFTPGVDKPLQTYVAVTAVPAQLRGAALPSLGKGVSFGPRAFKFTIPKAKAAQLTGKYLVFVVDTTNRALEFDETNNVSSAGPIAVAQ